MKQFFYEDTLALRERPVLGGNVKDIPYACGTVTLAQKQFTTGAATLVYFGGNQFRLSDQWEELTRFAERINIGKVIAFDYPGRGGTSGAAEIDCFLAAGRTVAEYAAARVPDGAPLIRHCFSFGGILLPHVIHKSSFTNLVLESTGASAEQWLRSMAPAGFKIDVPEALAPYNSVAALSGFEHHIWLVTGAEDRSAKPRVSKAFHALLEDAGVRTSLTIIPGAGHGELISTPQFLDAYNDKLH
jgi:pimeloyl-ACP methyl ester carboxylesterase